MEKKKSFVLIMIILIAVVAASVILLWPQAPKIPLDCTEAYASDTTCFGCHETGENDAPRFPSIHQEKIEDGDITDDIDSCIQCHEQEE